MTTEQIIEELKRLKAHNPAIPGDEQAVIDENVNAEVAQIEATIEEYNEKISALEAKIADESNYQYNPENEERDLTIEILEESFENQLEVIEREEQEYKNLQDIATTIFGDYNLEIASLNNDIAAIERRIRKNDIAVSKNIGIRLTEEELEALNFDLNQKRDRLKRCEELKVEYVEELRNYGELITINNRKREIVLSKQESLNKVKEHRDSKVGSIDNAKLRNDKDELASLKAGLVALNSRKEYITYNPNAEIDKLISALEQNKEITSGSAQENNDVLIEAFTPVVDELNLDAEIKPAESTEDKSQALINAYINGNEDLFEEPEKTESEPEIPLGIPEETSAHDLFVAGNPDLDLEREAEIEEAAEILKEKKKTPWFKQKWVKWVAAGLATIALISQLKSCGPKTNVPTPEDLSNNDISQSQTDEGITEEKEKEFDEKFEFKTEDELENKTPEKDTNHTQDSTPDPVPDPIPEPEIDPVPDPTPDPEVETGKVELEQGESVISAEDLLKGNITEDTVIEHGDEVGKTTDNVELKDYTEEGKAVVEFDKVDEPIEAPVEQPTEEQITTNRDQIIKNLEEFMGGEITFTEEGNQWIDQMSGKTR